MNVNLLGYARWLSLTTASDEEGARMQTDANELSSGKENTASNVRISLPLVHGWRGQDAAITRLRRD